MKRALKLRVYVNNNIRIGENAYRIRRVYYIVETRSLDIVWYRRISRLSRGIG